MAWSPPSGGEIPRTRRLIMDGNGRWANTTADPRRECRAEGIKAWTPSPGAIDAGVRCPDDTTFSTEE